MAKRNYSHQINTEEIVKDIVKKQDFGFNKKQYAETLLRKVNIKCKNQKQKEFSQLIDENEITICIGDSGVGKSYLSIAKALELFKSGNYEKIYIITPIVEIEDSIGFLKGSLEDKLAPYLYSIYYLVDKIVGEDVRKKLVETGIIEPLCISYLRGINLDNCLTVCDEAQNMSVKGILTLLTRIGYNTKFLISGDLNQIDRFKNAKDSGLKYAYEKLQGIPGIGFVEFGKEDIVRNPIIGSILEKFQENNI
jgi:phosphate starvation-inducible protein PhoH and related proteins